MLASAWPYLWQPLGEQCSGEQMPQSATASWRQRAIRCCTLSMMRPTAPAHRPLTCRACAPPAAPPALAACRPGTWRPLRQGGQGGQAWRCCDGRRGKPGAQNQLQREAAQERYLPGGALPFRHLTAFCLPGHLPAHLWRACRRRWCPPCSLRSTPCRAAPPPRGQRPQAPPRPAGGWVGGGAAAWNASRHLKTNGPRLSCHQLPLCKAAAPCSHLVGAAHHARDVAPHRHPLRLGRRHHAVKLAAGGAAQFR